MGTNIFTRRLTRFCLTILAFLLCLVGKSFAADDSLFRLQWGLKNTGDTQRIAIDHYTSGYVKGIVGEDIRLPEPFTAEKKVIVAVLDTGVDYTHPQLRNILASKGANFVGPKQDATDTHGHGTHISGIIAAQTGEDRRMNTGLRGVSSNVLILPVKVVQTGPNAPIRPQDTAPGAGTALTETVAKGIVYAIENGAQVINLSLAWPNSIRSQKVDEAMELAKQKNVVVVSSAGNDSTEANVYPCIYENVVCVGAQGSDGAFSHYSNFGGMVDLVAPGTAILSTWPMNKAPNTFAGQIGYEFRNGTSMASPFVAGAIAELIARGYGANEAVNRVLLGARKTRVATQYSAKTLGDYSTNLNSTTKFSRFGNLDLAQAIAVAPSPLILPTRKAPYDLKWDGVTPSISFEITFKNQWLSAKNVTLFIDATDVTTQRFEFASLETNQTISVPITLPMAALTPSSLSVTATITTEGYSKSFVIPVQITRIIKSDVIPSNAKIKNIIGLGDYSSVRSVVTSDKINRTDFVFLKKVDKALDLSLVQDSTLVAHALVPNMDEDQLLNFYRLPDATYAAIFSVQPQGSPRPDFIIQYFDETFVATSQSKIGTEMTVLSENFRWMKVKNSYVPVWISVGYTPKIDLPKFDPWDPNVKDAKMQRLYYLDQGELHTIRLEKNQLPLQIVPNGDILVSEGFGYLIKYILLTLEDGKILKQKSMTLPEYRMLVGLDTGEILLPLKGSHSQTLVLSGASTPGNLRVTAIAGDAESSFDSALNRASSLESLIQVVGSYSDIAHQYYFVQTHYDLKFYTAGSNQTISTSLNRYSYIPSMIFNRNFYSTVVKDQNGNGLPAVYVPATLANGFISEVIVADPAAQSSAKPTDQLYRPASLRFAVGDARCIEMGNLIPATETDPAQQVFVCGSTLIQVPLTIIR